MLFNSLEFMAFMVIVAVLFHGACRSRVQSAPTLILVIASLVFYTQWDVAFLPLLLGSIGANFVFGKILRDTRSPHLLTLFVALNITLIGVFKYYDFFAVEMAALVGATPNLLHFVLPLGISFFTFHQIIYLVEMAKGDSPRRGLLHYSLYVLFFPQLIAGPIIRYPDIVEQFDFRDRAGIRLPNLAIGLTLFAFGLFKKVIIADSLAAEVSPIFAEAAIGRPILFLEGWLACLGYTLQIYFDFSGYSDMARGLAKTLGFRFPVNFDSPYRSTSIIDFWRRWHITLSDFLRRYVYLPLGGNRKGSARRYVNLLAVMLVGGLWHGAGWTFVLWGGLHGLYLVVNHLWRAALPEGRLEPWRRWLGWPLTTLAVAVAWVLFRADSLSTAGNILAGMSLRHGIDFVPLGASRDVLLDQLAAKAEHWDWVLVAAVVALAIPNIHRIMERAFPLMLPPNAVSPRHPLAVHWQADARWALAAGLAASMAIIAVVVESSSEFIYFHF